MNHPLLPDLQPAHLREVCVDSATLFQGHFLHAMRDTVRLPDGSSAVREYIRHPGAVMVIPLLDDGRVVLERQYRYPLQRALLEFPAGKIDPGEDHFACARRELREETGYSAREWAFAGRLAPTISYSTEIIDIRPGVIRTRGIPIQDLIGRLRGFRCNLQVGAVDHGNLCMRSRRHR